MVLRGGLNFSDNFQKARRKSEWTTRKLAAHEARIRELEFIVRLLADDFVVVSGLKKRLAAQGAQIAALEESSDNFNKLLA